MTKDLVRLSEDERCFIIEGHSSVSISKSDGLVVMHVPIKGGIQRENIRGLSVDEDDMWGSSLYLDWRRGSLREQTYLGKIVDLDFARDFVLKVNALYRENAHRFKNP